MATHSSSSFCFFHAQASSEGIKSILEEKTHNFNVKQNRYMIKCYTEFERCHCESSEKEEVVWTDVVGECIEGEV